MRTKSEGAVAKGPSTAPASGIGDRGARQGRLAAVASLVTRGTRVADIGSGHGRLARRLLASGRCPYCVATERTPELLERIRLFPPAHPLASCQALRWGDGLDALRPADAIDTVVVAGLGGLSIVAILDAGLPRLRSVGRIVLQPQTDHGYLRRWLLGAGFGIVEERLAGERGRFYAVIAAEASPDAAPPSYPGLASEDLLEAGPCLVRERNPLLAPYWRRQQERLVRILARNPGGAARSRLIRQLTSAHRILRVASAWSGPA